MISTTRCPASWNSRSLRSTTAWPRWMSGAVGSIPSFTRSGRPWAAAACESFSAKRSCGQASRRRSRSSSGGRLVGHSAWSPMLDSRVPVELAASPAGGRPRLKRLRFVLILFAVLLLGLISFVFGMFVAVASDLPSLTRFSQLKERPELGAAGRPRPPDRRAQRTEPRDRHARADPADRQGGGDLDRGQALQDQQRRRHPRDRTRVRPGRRAQRHLQGASTIEQQFIKNALQAQSHRTILEKLREAALAYQLSHKWSKEKIITAYLNTIYFGNGAYGIESAAQTYFGSRRQPSRLRHAGAQLCVQELEPAEAALLAGIIQSPTEYNPADHPVAARERRDVVLQQMFQQGYIRQSRSTTKASTRRCRPPRKSRRPISRWWKASTWATSQAGCSSR